MASRHLTPVVRFLRRITASPAAGEVTDCHLLRRFLADHDEAAFAALADRHGPMVWGVCRRVLRDHHDAEDAFQATFLVLARKAGSIRRPELLGNWLYGVAYRTARKARFLLARRRARQTGVGDVPAPQATPDADRADLRAVLDEEVARLPEKHRVPFVLCYLEGRTNAEAARLLGCPKGTVLSRLAWARERLRTRLARRGLVPSAGLVALAGSENASAAVVPPSLATAAVRAATGQAAAGVVSAQLAEGVLRAMLMSKLKNLMAVVLGLGAAACLTGLLAYQTLAAGQAGGSQAGAAQPPAQATSGPGEVRQKGQVTSVKAMPPVVVRTVPQAGDTQVDAAKTTAIQVTFSKAMMDGSWSWTQVSEETFPKATGKPRYEKDGRTCVLPVKLEPGKTYVLWLNSAKFGNFKDADGQSAVPYLLVFETKP